MQQTTMPEYSAKFPNNIPPLDNTENKEEVDDDEEAFVETYDDDYHVKTEL